MPQGRMRGQLLMSDIHSKLLSHHLLCTGKRLSIAPRICILGGGFGGLYTAVRLENLLWPQGSKPQVTLIDQSARFVFKPLLYELLNGGASAEEVAPFFTKLLAPYSTNFIQVTITTHALLLLLGLRK